MEQPHFGRRLRQMRTERGLSQAALAGDGMSTGYLSRLESGARRPTERAIDYLTQRLGVDRSKFDEPGSKSFLQMLAIASSSDGEGLSEEVDDLLQDSSTEEPALRWQGFWLVAQRRLQQGRLDEARSFLEQAVRIADDLDIPELRCRARTQLARCLRSLGEINGALAAAEEAYRASRGADLSVQDVGAALLALISTEGEAGRLPDARAHADEILELTRRAPARSSRRRGGHRRPSGSGRATTRARRSCSGRPWTGWRARTICCCGSGCDWRRPRSRCSRSRRWSNGRRSCSPRRSRPSP